MTRLNPLNNHNIYHNASKIAFLLLFLLFISLMDETRLKFNKKHQNIYRFKVELNLSLVSFKMLRLLRRHMSHDNVNMADRVRTLLALVKYLLIGCFSISLLVSSLLYPPSYDPETDRAQPY